MIPDTDSSPWSLERARRVYNIANWASGYFDINAAGRMVARAQGDDGDSEVDLYALAQELREAGLPTPVLVRFRHILRDRVRRLRGAFEGAMRDSAYSGPYTAVYPIKVNQQRSVVEQILADNGGRVGLEAGSKPELLAVMALVEGRGSVICNGYKDAEYIRLALLGRALGLDVYIVIEKPSELETVLREAAALAVTPLLGLRVRLASIGRGKWQNTGGEKAKFGLSAGQVLALVTRLREASMLDSLRLLHFHMGSQIPNIGDIHRGVREAARYYSDLRCAGVAIDTVDVGGGLGVDYEGTRSRAFCSMNYTLQEYAGTIVRTLAELCRAEDLPHPHIITEVGRAMTAHHAVLIVDVIDTDDNDTPTPPEPPAADDPAVLRDLWRLYDNRQGLTPEEIYNEVTYWLGEAYSMHSHGVLSLAHRARAERLHRAICLGLQHTVSASSASAEIAAPLHDKLAAKYFCNFSVFQSIPDVWAFGQVFPIAPLHRLDERPSRRAVLHDLTCDSDGQISAYVEGERIEASLALHAPRAGQPYLLGLFLVGAYQEILGDMHNLFGDTHAVDIELAPGGGHRLLAPEPGDTIAKVLREVHIDPDELLGRYRDKLEHRGLTATSRTRVLEALEAGLAGYTYLGD